MADEAPIQDASPQEPALPQEPQTPEPVQPVDASVATPAEPTPEPAQEPQQPSQANEGADAPEPTVETPPPSDPDFDPLEGITDFLPQQYQFEPQEDGSVDPTQVAQAIRQDVLNQVRQEQKLVKDWQKVDSKYGDKLNNNVRQMIRDRQIAAAVTGKNSNLGKIADDIMSELSQARSTGRAEATTSTKVQRAASLETTTANSGPSKNDELMQRVEAGDKHATTDLLAQWLEQGKI